MGETLKIMARKNIFSILASTFDISSEIYVIDDHLTNKTVTYIPHPLSTKYKIEKISILVDSVFYNWKGRDTATNIQSFKQRIGIPEILEKIVIFENSTEEEVITYLEYALNISELFRKKFISKASDFANFYMLEDNLKMVIEKMNLKILPDIKHDGFELVVNNPEATLVAELMPEDVGIQIMRYHHHLLKGDLTEKASIIVMMAKKFEAIRKDLESKNYTKIASDTGFCLNKLNIRHNNEKEEHVASMDKEELEDWYDYTYQLLLTCFLLHDYTNTRERIDSIKPQKD